MVHRSHIGSRRQLLGGHGMRKGRGRMYQQEREGEEDDDMWDLAIFEIEKWTR